MTSQNIACLCKPLIIVKSMSEDKIICMMGPTTWKQFAYFRNIVHDADSDQIEIYFSDDFECFWKFIDNDFNKNDIVDFALNVKSTCALFGMEESTIFQGRLDSLLTTAALKLSSSPEFIATYESFYTMKKIGIETFVHYMNIREAWRRYCIEVFHAIEFEDPRNFKKMRDKYLELESLSC